MQQPHLVSCMPSLALEARVAPLDLEQFFFVLAALRQMPDGLSHADIMSTVTACLASWMCIQRKKPDSRVEYSVALTTSQLNPVFTSVHMFLPFVFKLQKCSVVKTLKESRVTYAARPLAKRCCVCNSDALEDKPSKRSTYFYSSSGPPSLGKLYFLECKNCKCVHELDGYVPSAGANRGKKNPKRPYPVELQHKTWFQSTYNTVIDIKLFERYSADLVFKASSFLAFVNVENYLSGTFIKN
jgi:hypothetical protein